MSQTIDLTPTWPAVLHMMIPVLLDGSPEGRKAAMEQLLNMAKVAQLHVEYTEQKERDEQRQIAIIWDIDDVREMCKQEHIYLDDKQCLDVLKEIKHSHDCNFGITWDTISFGVTNYCREREIAEAVAFVATHTEIARADFHALLPDGYEVADETEKVMICDYTGLVIEVLASGEYLVMAGREDIVTTDLNEAINHLRTNL